MLNLLIQLFQALFVTPAAKVPEPGPAPAYPSPSSPKGRGFYLDVLIKSPLFHSTKPINDPAMLEPEFRRRVQSMIAAAAARGVTLKVLETYRSTELQQAYFAKGVTKLRTVGVHHYGLACDLGIVVGGQVNWKADYSVLGPLAAAQGLIWGGDWGTPDKPHSFRDYDHVQRIAVGDQPQLFSGQWYPDAVYEPVRG